MQLLETRTRHEAERRGRSRVAEQKKDNGLVARWVAGRASVLWPALLIGIVFGMLMGAGGGWLLIQSDRAAAWRQWAKEALAGRSVAGVGAVDDHDHDHDDEPAVLELSEQARKNIGLTLASVTRRDFARSITVPGVIGERPGQTLVTVSAPASGVVRRIAASRGESVTPGEVLFEIALTHENLVDRQRALLLAVEQLDVVQRELARLDEATASGAVAGRLRLEREYERQTVEATINAEKQALVLHGLSREHVDEVIATRRLLSTLAVSVPPLFPGEHYLSSYHVVDLKVRPGDYIEAGGPLALLADHCELYVEGKAFERDATMLHRAVDEGVAVGVLVEESDGGKQEVFPLEIVYVENEVDRASRTLRFFVRLPNEIIRDHRMPDGRRFHAWRFKPGQRVELQIPVEWWPGRIVLPVDAVVREGAEWFVFREVDGRFHRTAVHVEYRDHRWAVVAADGAIVPGSEVAVQGAYQIHLAMKQQAGGGHDPHAGHHH